jgi:hypothetical protein
LSQVLLVPTLDFHVEDATGSIRNVNVEPYSRSIWEDMYVLFALDVLDVIDGYLKA